MKTLREKRDPSIIDQLLVVNKSAGRLRFVLFLLIIFIVWSFVAQTKLSLPAFLDVFIPFFPKPANFTSSIFQEILLTYLSPTTIFFTFIPFIIFLSSRQIIARFLHALFPAIELKKINRYFNSCAFSLSPRYFDISGQDKVNHDQAIQELTQLGGPAKITLRSDSIPIFSDIKDNTSSVIFPSRNTVKYIHFLSHGEVIESITARNEDEIFYDQISVTDGFERNVQINKISVKIELDRPEKKPQALVSQQLSKSDALFFYNLEKNKKEIITSFLKDEMKNFFIFEPSIINWEGKHFTKNHQNQGKSKDPLKTNAHFTYQNIIPVWQLLKKKTSRIHKHSLYQYLHKNEASFEYSLEKQRETDKIEQRILKYLNEQLRSFFQISNILISIIEIGEIKINGKNRILH